MRASQPNFFLPFDRTGIDPFTQRFPVTLRLGGTGRGTGGARALGERQGTPGFVPAVFPRLIGAASAGAWDLLGGGFPGGASHNAAWAMSSGFWAGAGAADYA